MIEQMRGPGLYLDHLDAGRILLCTVELEVPRHAISASVDDFTKALMPGTRIVIGDLSRTKRLTSSAIGLMVYYAKMLLSRGVQIMIVAPPPSLFGRFVSVALGQLVPFYGSLDACLDDARREVVGAG